MSAPRPAFLFPGQLSETVGMGRDLLDREPGARDLATQTSARCGLDLERLIREGPIETLRENLPAQAGVYLVSTLASRALARRGVEPPATAGYSLGNYAAMVAAGAISYEEGLEVLVAVWRETEALGIRGAMGAVV
jgi:[acyl-carrier-protein] S-malonyltransferase